MKRFYALLLVLFTSTTLSAQLIINEVLYDPSNTALDGDANGDGVYEQEGDSFIEFYNASNTNYDASGIQIWDDTTAGSLKYTVAPATFIPPGGVLVVFGGGTPTGTFGGAVVLAADTSASGLNLNNSGEIIVIKDANGNFLIAFNSDSLSNNPNESYTRSPDITGEFEQHATNTALLFSPGLKVDGTPFNTAFVVSNITVQGQGGATAITTNQGTLQMEAAVLPAFASNQNVVWSVTNGTGVASINAAGILTAGSDGTVTVIATAADGSGIIGSVQITLSNQTGVLVNNINVEGTGGETQITTPSGTLQMEANVLPANATITAVTWSVTDQTGSATIDANGMLTAVGNGTVLVTATATDGSGVSGSTVITITNQTTGIEAIAAANQFSIFPNPAADFITISGVETVTEVQIYSMDGKLITAVRSPKNQISVQHLAKGNYVVKVVSTLAAAQFILVKE